MDWGHLIQYALYGFVGLAITLLGAFFLEIWIPRVGRRGGLWYLEAIIMIAGPICVTTAALAQGPDGMEYGPFEAVNRYARYTAVGLAIIAIILGLKHPRRRIGGLTLSLFLFYFALVMSGLGGVVPGIPEGYYLTPLILFAFLIPGNYTYEWLLKACRASLRIMLLVTAVSALFLPTMAFRLDGTREAFGISQLQGLTGHPNTLAAIAVLGLLIEAGSRTKWPWRVLFAVAVAAAQSSTGYIAAVVGLLLLGNRGSRVSRHLVLGAALIIGIAFIFTPNEVESVISVVVPPTAETLTGRTNIWAAAMMGFEGHPWFGYGPSLLDDDFRSMYLPGFDAAAQAHNQLIQTLAGTGIVGTATLGFLALSLMTHAKRGFRSSGGMTWAIFAFIAIRCVTETPLRPTGVGFDSYVLIIVIGLIAVASSQISEAKPSDEVALELALPEALSRTLREPAGVT